MPTFKVYRYQHYIIVTMKDRPSNPFAMPLWQQANLAMWMTKRLNDMNSACLCACIGVYCSIDLVRLLTDQKSLHEHCMSELAQLTFHVCHWCLLRELSCESPMTWYVARRLHFGLDISHTVLFGISALIRCKPATTRYVHSKCELIMQTADEDM